MGFICTVSCLNGTYTLGLLVPNIYLGMGIFHSMIFGFST